MHSISRRLAAIRRILLTNLFTPESLRKQADDAIAASSPDRPAVPRDAVQHALGGARRVLQDALEDIRKRALSLFPFAVVGRLRSRCDRLRSQVSPVLASSTGLGVASIHSVVTAAVAALFVFAGATSHPSLASAAISGSGTPTGVVAATHDDAGAAGFVESDSARLAAAVHHDTILPVTSTNAKADARAGVNTSDADDYIQIGRDVFIQIGDTEYSVFYKDNHFRLYCDPEYVVRRTACATYRAAQGALVSLEDRLGVEPGL